MNHIDSAAIDSKINRDKATRDSVQAAVIKKRKDDSTFRELAKIQAQNFRDSLNAARIAKRKADSIAREVVKQKIIEDKRIRDSLTANNRRLLDSASSARKLHTDSLKTARELSQKERDKLTKYKNSKHYKDSVKNAKELAQNVQKTERERIRDSIATVRNHFNDSVAAIRKHFNDSSAAVVKSNLQALKTERDRIGDSLKSIRKAKSDSLLAIRTARDKKNGKNKEKDKTKTEKEKKLAIQLHAKKQEEWTNEKLLKRKWGLLRRIYQNTVTRYNYYYNAKRKYDDAMRTITKNNKEDYTKLVNVYPFDVQKSGSSIASDMDSVIKKASFSTQIHDPRSKWFDNLFFLMGRASYMKNDFEGAITTLQFVANEYKDSKKKSKKKGSSSSKSNASKLATGKDSTFSIASVDNRKGLRRFSHHPIRNEALIWLGKTYIQAEQYSEAQALLGTLANDKLFPKRNRADLYLTQATLDLAQKNNSDAIASLSKALKQKLSHSQKARTEFLIGQLYADAKDYKNSSEHFKKSVNGKANLEMDFYTQINIAQNAAKGGGDKSYAINQLEKIKKDSKYQKYQEQTTNVLASIIAEDNPDKAIEILNKSLAKSDGKNITQKAISFAQLGKIYYKQGEYELAKMAYDSASIFGHEPPIDDINEVNTRATVLIDVVHDIRTIRANDSLLLLSTKTEKEQKAIAKKELDRLKKLKADETTTEVITLNSNNNNNVKSNWYFYNNSLLEKGSAEFKQKWGTRKLEDNWRRSAVSSSGNNSLGGLNEENTEETNTQNLNGVSMYSLLNAIPKTPEQKAKLNDATMNAFYNLGVTYYAQLEDYKSSIVAFDSLLYRFPSTDLKKQTYFSLFLDNSKLGNSSEANRYKKLLNDEFGQSEFALLANNPNYKEEAKKLNITIDSYYDTTYLAYKDAKYEEALTRINSIRPQLNGNKLAAKYDLLNALCKGGQKEFPECKKLLESVIQKYPNTSEQVKAQDILNYLKNAQPDVDTNKTKTATNSSSKTSIDSTEAALDEQEIKSLEGHGTFINDSKVEHFVMISMKKIDGKTMALKSGISDYNLLKHDSEQLTTGLNLLSAELGVLTIRKFSNSVFAKIYMNDLVKEKTLFSQLKPSDYDMLLISAQNLTELLKTRDLFGYMNFYKKNYK